MIPLSDEPERQATPGESWRGPPPDRREALRVAPSPQGPGAAGRSLRCSSATPCVHDHTGPFTMSLNPLRDALGQAGLAASRHDSPFQAEADAALAGFRAVRQDLERR